MLRQLVSLIALLLAALIYRNYTLTKQVIRHPSPSSMSKLSLIPRRSLARGNADHGWLKSFHTFSFASYYDAEFPGFGPLRVINEDRVDPTTGFGAHSHKEFEIFSYIVSGELSHNDSMGNKEILKRGEIQMTSAGTGIQHSEYNTNETETVHFLQIWCKPNKSRLTPAYTTKAFSDDMKQDRLALVVQDIARPADGVVPINANLAMYASILSPKKTVTHLLERNSAYVHLIMTSGYKTPDNSARITVNGEELKEGDGLFVQGSGELTIESTGDSKAEFLLFDMQQ